MNRTDPTGMVMQDTNCAITCTVFGGPVPIYSATGIQTGTYNHEAALASVEVAAYGAALYQGAEAAVSLASAGRSAISLMRSAPEAKAVNLYRAVDPGELADIQQSGAFRVPPGGAEGKYFSSSLEGAQSYAKQASEAFGESYTVVQGKMSADMFTAAERVSVDSGVPAVFVRSEYIAEVRVVLPK